MPSDACAALPRGRPPLGVLFPLTLLALSVHGCVLGGMPLAGLQTPVDAAVPVAASVQVRQIAAVPPPAVPNAQRSPPAARSAPAHKMPPVPGPGTRHAPESIVVASAAPALEPAHLAPPMAAETVLEAAAASSPMASAALVATPDLPSLRQPERSVPVYKTRIPPLTTIEYEIRRGGLSGTGELSWRPASGRYEMRLEASIAGFTLLTQISQGGFDAAGLAPVRFTDQRARKAARAANFQREAGKVTFSGPRDEYALAAGSQDRLSWMIQLPAVLAGEPKRAAAGGEVVLYIASARGDMDLWDLHSSGAETIDTPSGALQTVKFTRAPRTARDTQAEVWLDPKRHYLPVRARLTQGESEAPLDLMLRELHTSP